MPYIPHDTGPDDSPPIKTLLTQLQQMLNLVVKGPMSGQVIDVGGINIGVFGLLYQISATVKTYAGQASVALTDDATNYVYLDGTSGTNVQLSTSAFPANVFVLAIVTCASGDITNVDDVRARNYAVGLTNDWAATAASGDVDVDDNNLLDVLGIDFTAPTKLTVSSGSITPTQFWHTVEGEGGAADTLDTIVSSAATRGKWLLLQAYDTGNVVTLTPAASSFTFATGYGLSYALDAANSFILFKQTETDEWIELARWNVSQTFWTANVSAEGFALTELGPFQFSRVSATIASGTFAYTAALTRVANESAASTDDLDTVTGASEGDILILYPTDPTDETVIKHAVGADKFLLANARDFQLDNTLSPHSLTCRHNGTQWIEKDRTPYEPRDMVMASASEHDAIPFNPGGAFHFNGALQVGDHDMIVIATHAFTIKNVSAYVVTPPSGAPCYFDVLIEPAAGGGFGSIFQSDGERPKIESGNNSDTSSNVTVEALVALGDKIKVTVLNSDGSPNGAADGTVVINGRTPCVEPYVVP
jgi:hypothetical protein